MMMWQVSSKKENFSPKTTAPDKTTVNRQTESCIVFYALLQRDDEVAENIKERGIQRESNSALWACLSRFTNYKDGSAPHHDLIATNAGMFFGAGYETTAHAITWALFELAADTSIQVVSNKMKS